jgi:hypothetical protein
MGELIVLTSDELPLGCAAPSGEARDWNRKHIKLMNNLFCSNYYHPSPCGSFSLSSLRMFAFSSFYIYEIFTPEIANEYNFKCSDIHYSSPFYIQMKGRKGRRFFGFFGLLR